MKNSKYLVIVVTIITVIVMSVADKDEKTGNETGSKTETSSTTEASSTPEYPIQDAWVYRYNIATGKCEFAACGYIDEYTSLVAESDKSVERTITGTYMYLGSIKGYQNEDKTIEVYQVVFKEFENDLTLTNDNIKLDYSGNRSMITVDGWIYVDGTTIIAVSPLYSE